MAGNQHFADDVIWQPVLINQLRQAGGQYYVKLAACLETCNATRFCLSGACIRCRRAFWQAMLPMIEEQIFEPARRERRDRLTAIRIAPAWGAVFPDDLNTEVCRQVMASAADTLRALSIGPAIVGLDILLAEDREGKTPPRCLIHAHVALAGWLQGKQEDGLRAEFPTNDMRNQSIKIRDVDEQEARALFAMKPHRSRQVSYPYRSQPRLAPQRINYRKPLRPVQAVALAAVEHEFGLMNRFAVSGIAEMTIQGAIETLHPPQGP